MILLSLVTNVIIGVLLIAFAIVSTILCIKRTPENLRGFYGIMFVIIALGALVGGIFLIVTSLL